MKIRKSPALMIAASVAVSLVSGLITPGLAQGPPTGFPNVVGALRTTPGCLGVETAQTASGKRVIFAWFENKKALVDWYHGDVHQKAMKTVFPNQTFDRQPRISSIGIELYGPLPGGVAVGGRFAPEALKVRGLREIEIGTPKVGGER
jgi:heme-degrading monooxygenase HmoA